MSKIIFLQNHRRGDTAPPESSPQSAKIIQRPRSQADRDRELRETARQFFAEELERSEKKLDRLLDEDAPARAIQAAREEIAYYKRLVADNTPAKEAQDSGVRVS